MWVLCIFVISFLFMWKWSLIHFSSPLELEISQERDQKFLIVEGQFPTWLDGVLVRNSSISIFKNGIRESHEFDGLAILHSFAFNQGQVVYTNRFKNSIEILFAKISSLTPS
ncbi:MAG: carotenoid oxygenase family protein [Parachlamydiaceae bacterium]